MKICILARKKLGYNTRVVRQAKVLQEAGHQVTVIALELPSKNLMNSTPEVRYLQIELNPFPAKVLCIVNHRAYALPAWCKRNIKYFINLVFMNIAKTSPAWCKRNIKYFINLVFMNIAKTSPAWCKRNIKYFINLVFMNIAKTSPAWCKRNIKYFINLVFMNIAKTSPAWCKRNIKYFINLVFMNIAKTSPAWCKRNIKYFINLVFMNIAKTSPAWCKRNIKYFINLVFMNIAKTSPAWCKRNIKYFINLVFMNIAKTSPAWCKRNIKYFINLVCMNTAIILIFIPAVIILKIQSYNDEKVIKRASNDSTNLKSIYRRMILPYMGYFKTIDFSTKTEETLNGEVFDYYQAHDSYALLAAENLRAKTNGMLIYDALEISTELSGNAQELMPMWLIKREFNRNKKIIQSANNIVAIGPALADWTASTYEVSEDIVVVRNCCMYQDITQNKRIKIDLNLRDSDKLCLVVGSVYRHQGIEQLIESIPHLDDDIHIAILGPVTQRGYMDELNNFIAGSKVNGRIHFPPIQCPDQVIEYASGADIGLIARQATTLNNKLCLPNKIFELIMARLPIASTQLSNIEAIVKEYDIGLIFDETDPSDIANKINQLFVLENYIRFKRNVHDASSTLNWETESAKYLEIFQS